MGIFERFQVEYVLLIYCLHKKENNQMCFTSHKVFKSNENPNKKVYVTSITSNSGVLLFVS